MTNNLQDGRKTPFSRVFLKTMASNDIFSIRVFVLFGSQIRMMVEYIAFDVLNFESIATLTTDHLQFINLFMEYRIHLVKQNLGNLGVQLFKTIRKNKNGYKNE